MQAEMIGPEQEALEKLLDQTRRRLVETGTRNRLVHVNRTMTRGNVLNIVNERAEAVYSTLCTGKVMQFLATGQARYDKDDATGDTTTEDPTWSLPTHPVADLEIDPERFVDSRLETALGPDSLSARLLKIAQEAQTAEEEQGVNILYLALGFLKWFEDKNSSIPREAPLVLLPVELVRNKRTSTFDLRLRDEDLVTNLPLFQRLKADFGVHLPELVVEEGWTPSSYFDRVRQVIDGRPGWAISPDAMQLGFFSFSKLLMFLDLAVDAWPKGTLEAHPLTRGLLYEGFQAETPTFGSKDRLDDVLPPSKLFHVVDADASQAQAIEEVRSGRSLVIQGPPGTGKSQTITNILATAVREGKTVLFVAEKMAALSVVHDRLVKVGLRDVCLELHSKSANKKAVLAELARTLGAAQAVPRTPAPPLALTASRDLLNGVATALHAPIGETGETGYSVLGKQVRYLGMGVPPPTLSCEQLATMTRADEDRICASIAHYSLLLQTNREHATEALRGIQRFDLQPTELKRAADTLLKTARAAESLRTAFEACRAALLLDIKPVPAQVRAILDLLDRLRAMPEGESQLVRLIFSVQDKPRLIHALCTGAMWSSAHASARSTFLEEAYPASVGGLRRVLARGTTSFFARFGSAYRQASATLAGYLRQPLPRTAPERVALVDRLLDLQRLQALLAEDEAFCAQSLAGTWKGERTDFNRTKWTAEWVQQVTGSRLAVSPEAATCMGQEPERLRALGASLRDAAPLARAALTEATEMLRLNPRAFGAETFEEVDLDTAGSRLQAMAAALEHYRDWSHMHKVRAQLCAEGLEQLAEHMDTGALSAEAARCELLFARAEQLWRKAMTSQPLLAAIDGLDRDDLVAQFARLEREHTQNNVIATRAHHLAQVPQGAQGQMKVVRGEIGKRRGHMALRKLFDHAPDAIQRIKPVLLMSPISIAQFLPPGKLSFDLLVIDEASQVRPEDALGAVARARQIVVVGDQKQLPPTSFFDRLVADEEEMSDVEEDLPAEDLLEGAARLDQLESILTLCEARGLPQRLLKWHYRSRVPSLIQVSNSEFYNDELILPPSPLQHDPKYGLCFTRVDGVYDRGGKRDNRIEGEAIVSRVIEHAYTQPDTTLGIVTFSAAQRNLVTELLELARRSDARLDHFLHDDKREPLFVKNIENVQGDERDIILISVCYGPSMQGGPLTSMSFGPVNSEGGGRRLNVLFTRARLRCEIFASFDPGSINTQHTLRDGPRILKRFLEYARTGTLHQPAPTGEQPETPFEEEVAAVIRSFGYLADPQVGSAGFRIDLGIRHPDKPGQYILAVECDGATYHSALWARERDRLRQDVLEHLGWRFFRVWSTDWFYNRRAAEERLRETLRSAHESNNKASSLIDVDPPDSERPTEPLEAQASEARVLAERKMPAYLRAVFPSSSTAEPHEADKDLLARLAGRIVEAEGPIHDDEVARRIAACFGRERAGSRIHAAAQEALERARHSSPSLLCEHRFWFTESQRNAPPVRDRSAEEGATVKPANISLLEIREALTIAHADNAGGSDADLIRAVARLLGFRRVGPDLQARIASALSTYKNER